MRFLNLGSAFWSILSFVTLFFSTSAFSECHIELDANGNIIYICEDSPPSDNCRQVYDYLSGTWVLVCN